MQAIFPFFFPMRPSSTFWFSRSLPSLLRGVACLSLDGFFRLALSYHSFLRKFFFSFPPFFRLLFFDVTGVLEPVFLFRYLSFSLLEICLMFFPVFLSSPLNFLFRRQKNPSFPSYLFCGHLAYSFLPFFPLFQRPLSLTPIEKVTPPQGKVSLIFSFVPPPLLFFKCGADTCLTCILFLTNFPIFPFLFSLNSLFLSKKGFLLLMCEPFADFLFLGSSSFFSFLSRL